MDFIERKIGKNAKRSNWIEFYRKENAKEQYQTAKNETQIKCEAKKDLTARAYTDTIQNRHSNNKPYNYNTNKTKQYQKGKCQRAQYQTGQKGLTTNNT